MAIVPFDPFGRLADVERWKFEQNRLRDNDMWRQKTGDEEMSLRRAENALRMMEYDAKRGDAEAQRQTQNALLFGLENQPYLETLRGDPQLYNEAQAVNRQDMLRGRPLADVATVAKYGDRMEIPGQKGLTGDAANLAIILGRNPTFDEISNYRRQGATTIDMGTKVEGAGETEFAKKVAANYAQAYDDALKQRTTATENLNLINAQRAAIEGGYQTGKLAPVNQAISGYVTAFGIDPQKLGLPDPSKGELFSMSQAKNLLDALAAQKGPQTEGDAKRAASTFATLENTPAGNKFILDYMEAFARRQQEYADYVERAVLDASPGQQARAFAQAQKEYLGGIKGKPLIGTSPTTRKPVTYYQYAEAAAAKGMDQKQIDDNWKAFVAGKK